MSTRAPGIALHNPCDLERGGDTFHYDGEVIPSSHPVLRQFISDAWGMRACLVDFQVYITRDGVKTLGEAIARYAPPEENDTTAYTAAVCDACSATSDAPFATAWLHAHAAYMLDVITVREVGMTYPAATVALAISLAWDEGD
ncbi:MAG: hypothetical protein ACRDF8_00750 [Chloroflexota bacterium]